MENVLSILLGIWRGILRDRTSTTLGMRTFYSLFYLGLTNLLML
jgi:hypothetical protein